MERLGIRRVATLEDHFAIYTASAATGAAPSRSYAEDHRRPRPQSGHSVGPVAKVVPHAGQVISGALWSMTLSAARRSASLARAYQSSCSTWAARPASSLATASQNFVPQPWPAPGGQTISEAIPERVSTAWSSASSALRPWATAAISSAMVARR